MEFRRVTNDLVELVEHEQQLGQLVERLVARAELRAVPELLQDPVADRVNRPHSKLGQISCVADLPRHLPDPVTQLEGRLLGERADDDLRWVRPT